MSIEHAMAAGELPGLDDARQLTFELVSFLEAANTRSLLHASTEPYHRAAGAVRSRLLSLGADPSLVGRIVRTRAGTLIDRLAAACRPSS